MKKLISLLGSICLAATATTTVLACDIQQEVRDYDKLVGRHIDRSKAIDDSDLENELGYTNFYTIGDSLSDSGGIETIVSETIQEALNFAKSQDPAIIEEIVDQLTNLLSSITGMPSIIVKPIVKKILELINEIKTVNVNLKLVDNDNNELTNYQHGFTNEKPAAVILAESLGFNKETNGKQFKAGLDTNVLGLDVESNKYTYQDKEYNGNNYAIGGAKASKTEGLAGMFLDSFKIDEQATALLKQHTTKPSDLVFMEIGGNDLFSMVDKFKAGGSKAEIDSIMDQAISKIKKSLLTLLNNNVTNIIVSNAPDISKLPRYIYANEEIKNKAQELSLEFNERFIEKFDEINTKYNNTMRMYNLGKRFDELLNEFKVDDSKIVDQPSSTIGADFKVNFSEDKTALSIDIINKVTVDINKINDYFFWDTIHPNSWAHEQVANDLYKIATEMRNK